MYFGCFTNTGLKFSKMQNNISLILIFFDENQNYNYKTITIEKKQKKLLQEDQK